MRVYEVWSSYDRLGLGLLGFRVSRFRVLRLSTFRDF